MWSGSLSRSEVFSSTDRGLSGFMVGLLHIACTHPLLPGNPQNASSFDFPVLYEAVVGADAHSVMRGDEAVAPALVAAAHRLEQAGVAAIVGICGSFAHFHGVLTGAATIPVYASILMEAEFLVSALPKSQKMLIVFADIGSDTPKLRAACGLRSHDRIKTAGCLDLTAFQPLVAGSRRFDVAAFRDQFSRRIDDVLEEDPSIGAIMLQCGELAPFAADLQAQTGLPVHDATLLVRSVHASLTHRPPEGFMARMTAHRARLKQRDTGNRKSAAAQRLRQEAPPNSVNAET